MFSAFLFSFTASYSSLFLFHLHLFLFNTWAYICKTKYLLLNLFYHLGKVVFFSLYIYLTLFFIYLLKSYIFYCPSIFLLIDLPKYFLFNPLKQSHLNLQIVPFPLNHLIVICLISSTEAPLVSLLYNLNLL